MTPGELDLRHALEVVLAREGDLERDRVRNPGTGLRPRSGLHPDTRLRPGTALRPGAGLSPDPGLLAPHRSSLRSLHRPLR